MRGFKAVMEKGKIRLSVSSQRWLGMRGWLGDEVMAQFKGCCYIRAWDPDSKTWFFPESFEPLVRAALGIPQNLPPNIRLEPRPRVVSRVDYADAVGDRSLVFASGPMEPHWLDSDPYKVLCISEDSPMGLVEAAAAFWRYTFSRDNGGIGGFDEPGRRVEEALEEIKRARLAQDEVRRTIDGDRVLR